VAEVIAHLLVFLHTIRTHHIVVTHPTTYGLPSRTHYYCQDCPREWVG